MFNVIRPTAPIEIVKRFLAFAGSMVMHGVIILVLAVLPLVFFNALPEWQLLTWLRAEPKPPAPLPPPSPPPGEGIFARPRPRVDRFNFDAPKEIPDGIPAPLDEPPVVDLSMRLVTIQPGVPGGVLGGGGIPEVLKPVQPVALPPPPAPKASMKPIPVGGVVQEAKLVRRVVPEYPELAKRARVQGSVILQVSVDEEGNVFDVRVLSGHPLLNEAAEKAVRQWKYSPTLLNGEPVPVTASVTVAFSLR